MWLAGLPILRPTLILSIVANAIARFPDDMVLHLMMEVAQATAGNRNNILVVSAQGFGVYPIVLKSYKNEAISAKVGVS
jgi:hypothetical protein